MVDDQYIINVVPDMFTENYFYFRDISETCSNITTNPTNCPVHTWTCTHSLVIADGRLSNTKRLPAGWAVLIGNITV